VESFLKRCRANDLNLLVIFGETARVVNSCLTPQGQFSSAAASHGSGPTSEVHPVFLVRVTVIQPFLNIEPCPRMNTNRRE
jgi:hypothetical protein